MPSKPWKKKPMGSLLRRIQNRGNKAEFTKVHDYFCAMKSAIIRLVAKNPDKGEFALDLLMIAKYLERIGDHCTNIAEWVEFSITGVHKSCQ